MDEDHVGQYITRVIATDPKERPLTLPHLVQTKVNESYITKCGRNFREEISSYRYTRLKFENLIFKPLCQNCR